MYILIYLFNSSWLIFQTVPPPPPDVSPLQSSPREAEPGRTGPGLGEDVPVGRQAGQHPGQSAGCWLLAGGDLTLGTAGSQLPHGPPSSLTLVLVRPLWGRPLPDAQLEGDQATVRDQISQHVGGRFSRVLPQVWSDILI